MKSLRINLIGVAFAGALVAGCGTNPITGTPITAADVQNAAVAACGFLPTVSTVAGIISTSSALTTAEAVASAICAAVAPQKAAMKAGRKGFAQASVNGIVVHGRFVR